MNLLRHDYLCSPWATAPRGEDSVQPRCPKHSASVSWLKIALIAKIDSQVVPGYVSGDVSVQA